jgi:Probable sensor domain DACNV
MDVVTGSLVIQEARRPQKVRRDNERMNERAYAVARVVAPRIYTHFSSHQHVDRGPEPVAVETIPDEAAIEAMIDTAFWASLRREEVYVPKISLAFLTPADAHHPLVLERPLPLDPAVLTRVSPAVERPGIHLGVAYLDGKLGVWGTVQAIPIHCFVVEVVEPGLIVVKHRRGREAAKFVNVVVLEGDRIKVIDEKASAMPDCPTLLSTLLGLDGSRVPDPGSQVDVLVQLAVSMRAHRRGGMLIVLPPGTDVWRESIVQPISYAARPPFSELAHLVESASAEHHFQWEDSLKRAVDAVAGLTAVDGATLMTSSYDVLAFGAKIARRRGQPPVEQMTVTEPVEGNAPIVMNPTTFGGTRHLSAAQFVHDQRDAVALVAGQDGRFTVFAWSPCIDMVHAHRVETLLL